MPLQSGEFDQQSPVDRLITIMRMLRDREFGCPWDLEQSLQSLIPYTLEEAYEVVDAIEKNDMVELEDELGDLLFQVVFYAQLAREAGHFDFNDVAAAITRKLIRRHPHVFPDQDVTKFGRKAGLSPDQVVVNWEAIKQQEKAEKAARLGHAQLDKPISILDDVPAALPALARATKLQKRAAKQGFDWQSLAPVLNKLREEVGEFETALREGDNDRIRDELGDILFAAVNLARHSHVDPEVALRGANSRFAQRFKWIEESLAATGKKMPDCDLEELDKLWESAKARGL